MYSMTYKEMQGVLNTVMIYITEEMAGIHLKSKENISINDACTVNVVFEGNCDVKLSLCADKLFFMRITKGVLQEDDVTEQDIQDTAKEYLNVICGKLIAQIFHTKYKPTRFKLPIFENGEHIIDDNVEHVYQACYSNEYNENMMLVITMSIKSME